MTTTSTTSVNYWKWGIFVAIAVALFMLGRCNGIRSVTKNTGVDTAINKDSIVVRYKPIPYKVREIDTQYIAGKPVPYAVHDTTLVYEVRIDPADTAAILKRFFETAYYDHTLPLQRGTVRIIDTVSQNRIWGRQVMAFGTDTTITKTIVLKPPRNIVGYFSLSAMGNYKNPLYGAGIGFGIKLPNDMTYQAEVKAVRGQRLMYEGRAMFPIRFIKPK